MSIWALIRREKYMPDKDYLTYDEAMEVLGVKRSTLHTMIIDQGIQFYKFKYDKRRYLTRADVMRLKQIREKPWTAGEEKQEPAVA
jgi:excisionase family DNA binding protein